MYECHEHMDLHGCTNVELPWMARNDLIRSLAMMDMDVRMPQAYGCAGVASY